MSWAVSIVGLKEKILEKIVEVFDEARKDCNDEEKEDLNIIQATVITIIKAYQPNEHFNGVEVIANGIRLNEYVSLNLQVNPRKIAV